MVTDAHELFCNQSIFHSKHSLKESGNFFFFFFSPSPHWSVVTCMSRQFKLSLHTSPDQQNIDGIAIGGLVLKILF